MLELYFKQAMAFAYTKDPSYICAFLSSDILDETKMNPRSSKEGVLSKYKGFFIGGWKSMYFVLEGTKLEYYSCVEYCKKVYKCNLCLKKLFLYNIRKEENCWDI